jgi:hypothetical protein
MMSVEWASFSPPNSGGGNGSGTIPRSALMHVAGMGRVDLVNYSTCLHRLARVVALPTHPSNWDDNDCDGGGPEWSAEGLGCCLSCNLLCWCARSGDGLQGGPVHVRLGGEQRPGKLGNRHWRHGRWGRRHQGEGCRGCPWHHCWWRGRREAPPQVPGANGNEYRLSPHPCPCLHRRHHWQGMQ